MLLKFAAEQSKQLAQVPASEAYMTLILPPQNEHGNPERHLFKGKQSLCRFWVAMGGYGNGGAAISSIRKAVGGGLKCNYTRVDREPDLQLTQACTFLGVTWIPCHKGKLGAGVSLLLYGTAQGCV